MIGVDFDFARYVSQRRGQMEQRARDGAAYAFGGELKARRMLATARPVTIALEASARRWRSSAKDKLLAEGTKVTDQSYPALRLAGQKAAERLGLRCPPIFVARSTTGIEAEVLGTDSDPILAVSEALANGLSDEELVALAGYLLGGVQNNHVMFSTALFYLRHDAFFFVRWIVQPAVMALNAWARRADITCDRAAMLASADLEVALSCIIKVGTGDLEADVPNILASAAEQAEERHMIGIFKSHPNVPRRLAAMRLFSESALFQRVKNGKDAGGRPTEEVDAAVSELISIF